MGMGLNGTYYLLGLKDTRTPLIATCLSAIVTVVLDLLLIPSYGINGAASASTASYCLFSAVTFFVLSKSEHKSVLTYFLPSLQDVKRVWLIRPYGVINEEHKG